MRAVGQKRRSVEALHDIAELLQTGLVSVALRAVDQRHEQTRKGLFKSIHIILRWVKDWPNPDGTSNVLREFKLSA